MGITREAIGYLCSTARECEVGSDYGGTTIYWSEKSARDHCTCIDLIGESEDAYVCRLVTVKVMWEG